MKRRVLAIAIVLILCVTVGSFAAEKKSSTIPWWVTYGGTDVAVGVGYTQDLFGASAALNLTFGQFDIGPIPLSWGGTVGGEFGFGYGLGLGVGAFVTLETGWDFGSIWKFEWRVGIGPAIALDLGGGFGIGFGQYASWTWWFTDAFGLTAQDMWSYTFGTADMSAYTIGVELKL